MSVNITVLFLVSEVGNVPVRLKRLLSTSFVGVLITSVNVFLFDNVTV